MPAARALIIADDDLSNRLLLRGFLKSTGLTVLEADNGLRVLDLCQSHTPVAVLLDLKMPELDGWETARRLKASPATQHVPLVAMSAVSWDEDKLSPGEASLWDAHIDKPFSKKALLLTLHRFVPIPELEAHSTQGGNP